MFNMIRAFRSTLLFLQICQVQGLKSRIQNAVTIHRPPPIYIPLQLRPHLLHLSFERLNPISTRIGARSRPQIQVQHHDDSVTRTSRTELEQERMNGEVVIPQ
ncbi:hypothetical protein Droror1_Dr00000682 [Drosera rotundifolia]